MWRLTLWSWVWLRPSIDANNYQDLSFIKQGTLVYPLERRTASGNIARFRISRDSNTRWVTAEWNGKMVFTKVEEETEEMTAAKVKAVEEDKVKRKFEAKRPLQYDYRLGPVHTQIETEISRFKSPPPRQHILPSVCEKEWSSLGPDQSKQSRPRTVFIHVPSHVAT